MRRYGLLCASGAPGLTFQPVSPHLHVFSDIIASDRSTSSSFPKIFLHEFKANLVIANDSSAVALAEAEAARSPNLPLSTWRGVPRAARGGVRFRDAGYTLVAIMVFMTLLAIAVLVVSPSVSKIMQRDREEELIFRGRQYAQAFLNFQKRQGRFPLKLEELMSTQPRSARQLYKEPMCNCPDWGLIRVGQPWPPPTTSTSTNPAGGVAFDTGAGATAPGTSQTRPGSPVPGTYSSPPAGTGGGGGTGGMSGNLNLGGSNQTVSNAPIIGVYSKLHKKGLRTFHGFEYYDQWGFIAGANNDPDLPGNLPAVFPGIPTHTPAPGSSTTTPGQRTNH